VYSRRQEFCDSDRCWTGGDNGNTTSSSSCLSSSGSDISILHLETKAPKRLVTDALDDFGIFRRKRGVTIGEGECLPVEMAKIGEVRELGCDHVRQGEWALRWRRVDGLRKAASRCIVVAVFNKVKCVAEGRVVWTSSPHENPHARVYGTSKSRRCLWARPRTQRLHIRIDHAP